MSCLQRFCTSGATRIAERRSRGFIAVPFPMFPPLINEGVAARPFFPPDNIAEGKRKRLKDVNVSKTINIVGVLLSLCYYKEEVLSEMARK